MVWNRKYTHTKHTFWNNNMHNILSFTCKKWNIWTIFIQTKYWRHIAGGSQPHIDAIAQVSHKPSIDVISQMGHNHILSSLRRWVTTTYCRHCAGGSQTKYWSHVAGKSQTKYWRHFADGLQTINWRHVAGGSLCVRDNADVSCWRFKPPTVARRRLLPCSGRVDDVCVCHWTWRPNRRVFKGTWTLTVTFRDDIHFKSNHVY